MSRIETAFFEIGSLDTLAGGDTFVHRLDPRAKVVTTLIFICCVVSFQKYQLSALLPFFIFPAVLLTTAQLPVGFLLKKLLFVAPFAFFIGVFNPFFDQTILFHVGPVGISGGWVSFASIMLRFCLTISMALILIATTSFNGVCMALEKIGAPRVFTVQLLLLHRYLFVLVGEASRLVKARALRSFNGRGTGMTVFGHIVGQLLLRTLDRAQRIHLAMQCRGFTGEIHQMRLFRFGWHEFFFTLAWSAVFLILRFYNLSQLLGGFLLEFAQ
ncbi:cobalt ECF transporter T component CbiQ [Malonomonas rubra]|uniref:cobalt ECF transporter T component CbiQ n=1 Tax=Malonomonas rubra TaxID=57040 RepID=UPI0026EA3006|nr:cobalt ECF transporter T component CbiQ [Malonomonas rubra]